MPAGRLTLKAPSTAVFPYDGRMPRTADGDRCRPGMSGAGRWTTDDLNDAAKDASRHRRSASEYPRRRACPGTLGTSGDATGFEDADRAGRAVTKGWM